MIQVECTASGMDNAVDPIAIWFGARRVQVLAVTDRWHGRTQRWWKVQTIDGLYIVRLDELASTWELAAVVRE
jgi:hypothetical protein